MQLLGLGLIPFFLSTLFQYLFAALDEQRRFLVSTCVGSALRILLLVVLIPRFGFAGPAMAFVCAETVIVGIWMFQLQAARFSGEPGQRHLASTGGRIRDDTCAFRCERAHGLSGRLPGRVVSVIVYARCSISS